MSRDYTSNQWHCPIILPCPWGLGELTQCVDGQLLPKLAVHGGASILKQCHSPEGRGRVFCPLHISGLSRFPGAPLAWLPILIYLSKPPALRGEHTLLQKAKPSPRFCFPWCLMICICRIETGKQYINVCANFPSLLHLLSLFTFYLYRMCAV